MYGTYSQSESQWQEIGQCPDCHAPLYLMGEKVKWHDCPYNIDVYVDLVDQINESTEKVNAIREKMKGKSLDEVILELRTEANYNNEVYRKGLI